MEIKGISNNSPFVNQPKGKKTSSVQAQDPKDKIVISPEARNLAKGELSAERIEELHQRIASGFYEADDVLKKVVEKILNEIQK